MRTSVPFPTAAEARAARAFRQTADLANVLDRSERLLHDQAVAGLQLYARFAADVNRSSPEFERFCKKFVDLGYTVESIMDEGRPNCVIAVSLIP